MPNEPQCLAEAASRGDLREVVRLLDQEGVDVNGFSNCRTALINAADHGHPQIVATLIGRGADVNAQDEKDHWTALMMAARGGRADIVKVLLNAGARVDITNISGDSALTYAVKSGDSGVLRQLLDAAAIRGNTAKQIALDSAMFEVQRKLDRLNEMRDDLGRRFSER